MIIHNNNILTATIDSLKLKYPFLSDYWSTTFQKYLIKEYTYPIGFKQYSTSKILIYKNYETTISKDFSFFSNIFLGMKLYPKIETHHFSIATENQSISDETVYYFDHENAWLFCGQNIISLMWFILSDQKFQKQPTHYVLNNQTFKAFSKNHIMFNCSFSTKIGVDLEFYFKKYNLTKTQLVYLATSEDFHFASALTNNCLNTKHSYTYSPTKYAFIQDRCYGICAYNYMKLYPLQLIMDISGYNNNEIKNNKSIYNLLIKLPVKQSILLLFNIIISKGLFDYIGQSLILLIACSIFDHFILQIPTNMFKILILSPIIISLLYRLTLAFNFIVFLIKKHCKNFIFMRK